jgi:hypothetical protein
MRCMASAHSKIYYMQAHSICFSFAPVAQLDRASVCGTGGRRFESCRVYQITYG